VSRDLERMRRENRRLFRPQSFDPVAFVVEKVAVDEALIRKTLLDAHHTRDVRVRVLAYRAAAEINQRITDLLEDAGFIDRRIGTLVIDDDTPATRISGLELQERWKQYRTLVVSDTELTSAAEIAWNFGSEIESTAAALEATQGAALKSDRNNRITTSGD
jgi:hypothetical protein